MCQALLVEVADIAAAHGAHGVQTVRLRIGPLSGMDAALLETAWPLASAGSVAQGAQLQVENLPVRVRCRDCDAESAAEPSCLLCGACGGYRTQLLSGDEMLLVGVELVTES